VTHTTRSITLPYGSDTRTISIPAANLSWLVGPHAAPAVGDLPTAIRNALRSPIGSPALPELVAHHGKNTVILVDDNTRTTPQPQILPVLLDELNAAGVPDSSITGLIALGTHRPMSASECLEHYGEETLARICVENLSPDADDFVDLGTTPQGIPIHVSRRYLESDISIAVGSIIPHMYAGWSGGAKMVQPGVTDHLTTAMTHLIAGPRVYDILRQPENSARSEMEEVAVRSGLKFILNVVLSSAREVSAAVAGDVIAAHRAGVDIARKIYTVTVPSRPDIVIATSHPADRDLWQGVKALNNCGMLVRDGGTLILLHPAPEGIAHDHPALTSLGITPAEDVLQMVERGEIHDGVAAATYLALDQTRKRARVVLVSIGIIPEDAAQIGLEATTDHQAAIQAALARHGSDASIGVVTAGAEIFGQIVP